MEVKNLIHINSSFGFKKFLIFDQVLAIATIGVATGFYYYKEEKRNLENAVGKNTDIPQALKGEDKTKK